MKLLPCSIISLSLLVPLGCSDGANEPDEGSTGSGGQTAASTGGSATKGEDPAATGGSSPHSSTGGAAASGGAVATGGATPDGSGGSPDTAALDAKCTPSFTLDLQDDGPGGDLFMEAVDNDPEGFVQEIGRTVCRILYRTPEEVRDANHITLHIEDYDGVAAKWGDVGDIDVQISTQHLTNVSNQGSGAKGVADEVTGILLHEMTHMYQNDDKPEATSPYLPNMYEGIADFVRARAGFMPNGRTPSKSGNWYDKTYSAQAFFWLYVDTAFPGFIYELNATMVQDGVPWSPDSIEEITGKTGDLWWTEFQGAACCDGATQTCCQ